tara:strand:- start:5143 stop:5655 length:513 start_codon:yes stop_codon:yes gene_type:complete
MSKVMKCNGQYIKDHACYPLCPSPDGWGCDTSSIFGGGDGIGGPTDNYTVTTGNAVSGNTSTRTNVSPIDPYQSITPDMLNASGDLWFGVNGEQQNNPLWFNQSGDAVIKVDGDTYAYEPVLTWDRGCDAMDDSGDGIMTNKDCSHRSKFGGVPGLRLGAYRFKNGVMDN